MKRQLDDDPMARLLARVETPPAWSDVQVERTLRRIQAGPPPRTHGWLRLSLAGALAALLVMLGWRGTQPRMAHRVSAAAGETVILQDDGRMIALVGPGAIAYDVLGEPTLDHGRLVVRSGSRPVVVGVPGGRISVPAGATAEVVVPVLRAAGMKVAAYEGRPRIEWQVSKEVIELATGHGAACGPRGCEPPAAVSPGAAEQAVARFRLRLDEPRPAGALASVVAPASPASPAPTREPMPRPSSAATATPPAVEAPPPPPFAHAAQPASLAMATTARPAPSLERAAPASAPPRLREEHEAPPPGPLVEPVRPAPGLGDEIDLIEEALHTLRQRHDPAGALDTTRKYRVRFAAGALAGEADRIDVEALLALGRDGDALRLVDRMALAPGHAQELHLLRGELRAGAGRCAEALDDFANALLGAGVSDRIAERGLFGRAACRLRLRQGDGARADLTRYLQQFPRGGHVDEVRRALGRR
jgi:hypothetical protein